MKSLSKHICPTLTVGYGSRQGAKGTFFANQVGTTLDAAHLSDVASISLKFDALGAVWIGLSQC